VLALAETDDMDRELGGFCGAVGEKAATGDTGFKQSAEIDNARSPGGKIDALQVGD
jgi:hypothetical protein